LRVLTRSGTVAATMGLMALFPAVTQAATRSVSMGTPAANQPAFQATGSDVNDFFPHGVTIHVGDRIKFVPSGFHTVEIPAKGSDPAAFVVPDGKKVAGVKDAAQAPFWFNGLDEMGLNPVMFTGLYGKKVTLKAAKGLQSGLPLAPNPKPVTVKFTKAGKVTYYCTLHPGMKGTVRVKKRGTRIPTLKQHRKAVRRQVKRDLKIAKGLAKRVVPAGTVDLGVAGRHGVEYFGMLPGTINVNRGTTLRFRMTQGSYEAHTATFGPGNPETEPTSYLGVLTKSFESPVIDARALYPSERPGTPASLTKTLHGNGFWNSGVLDSTAASVPPDANSVKFDTAGSYTYYCLIHPFMKGTVVVK
jgi:plastocyanin